MGKRMQVSASLTQSELPQVQFSSHLTIGSLPLYQGPLLWKNWNWSATAEDLLKPPFLASYLFPSFYKWLLSTPMCQALC